jgi:hypothetical protein
MERSSSVTVSVLVYALSAFSAVKILACFPGHQQPNALTRGNRFNRKEHKDRIEKPRSTAESVSGLCDLCALCGLETLLTAHRRGVNRKEHKDRIGRSPTIAVSVLVYVLSAFSAVETPSLR